MGHPVALFILRNQRKLTKHKHAANPPVLKRVTRPINSSIFSAARTLGESSSDKSVHGSVRHHLPERASRLDSHRGSESGRVVGHYSHPPTPRLYPSTARTSATSPSILPLTAVIVAANSPLLCPVTESTLFIMNSYLLAALTFFFFFGKMARCYPKIMMNMMAVMM